MKNIKKTFLAISIGLIAISISAYRNTTNKYIGENFIVQISANHFKPVWNTPDAGMCITNDSTSLKCFYYITLQGKINMPQLYSWQTYTGSQIFNWLYKYPYPYLANIDGSTKGIYYYGD